MLESCKDSLHANSKYIELIDQGDGVTNTDTLHLSINPVRHNISLLLHMLKMVDDCTGWKGCPGDSGDVHCILCRHNVLSTEELKKTNWSELNGQVVA